MSLYTLYRCITKSSHGEDKMYLKHVVDVQGQRQADVVLTAAEGGARDHGAQGRGALQGGVIDRTQ